MSAEDNKELMLRIFKGFSGGARGAAKLRSIASECYAPGFVYHHASRGDMNLEQATQYLCMAFSGFPDMDFSVDDMLAEGDEVVTRWTIKGTNKRSFAGIPATGKRVQYTGIVIDRIAAGKVVEAWEVPDTLGLMTQLGAIPAPRN